MKPMHPLYRSIRRFSRFGLMEQSPAAQQAVERSRDGTRLVSPRTGARRRARSNAASGFTLVELLTSTVVLAILLLVIASATDSMQRSWRRSKERVDQFREARAAFESITRQLSQATLNTYWDYYYSETNSNVPPSGLVVSPAGYVRQSELHFISGSAKELLSESVTRPVSGHALFFQAPLGHSADYRGLGSLLNGRGFYVQWRSDANTRPSFLPARFAPVKERFQLVEYRPVAEAASVDGVSAKGNTVYVDPDGWFEENLEKQSRAVASNILALIVSPQVAQAADGRDPWWIAPSYRYDSRDADNSTLVRDNVVITADGEVRQGTQHLLPPIVRVTLVAADEDSFALWMADNDGEGDRLLEKAGAAFTDAAKHDNDLAALKTYLGRERINYRVFSMTVPLRNAAWDSRLN